MTYHDISRQLQAGLIPIIQRLLRHLQSWWSPNSIKSSRSVVACCLMSKRIRALSSYGCSCIIQMWKDTHRDLFWSEARCLWRAMQVQCSCNVQHNVTQCDTTCQVSPFLKDSVKAALNSALLRSSGWGLGQAVVIHSDNPFTKHTFYVHSLSSYCLFIYSYIHAFLSLTLEVA